MPTLFASTLILGALASGLLLGLLFALRAKYNLKFLDRYTYFILVVVCFGIVNWIGPSLLAITYTSDEVRGSSTVLLFALTAVPLALGKLWLFVSLLWSMLEERPGKPLARSMLLFSGLCIASIVASIMLDPTIEQNGPAAIALTFLGAVVLAANLLAISYFLARSTDVTDPDLKSYARKFGWSYMVGYAVYASPFYLSYIVDISWYPVFAPYVYYLLHIVPVFFVWRYCIQLERSGFSRLENIEGLDNRVEEFDISTREVEVLGLLLMGLNNAEIATRLFISPNTVRNHVYSIYKKTGVKNRMQLRHLFDG